MGADYLVIVSGHATAAMAFHHLTALEQEGLTPKVRLIVGMQPAEGITLANHQGFQQLAESCAGRFQCSYVMSGAPVHSKAYVWFRHGQPFVAFAGSADYSLAAFRGRQREIMSDCDPNQAYDYFLQVEKDTIYCNHSEVQNHVRIHRGGICVADAAAGHGPEPIGLEKVEVSLLTSRGDATHRRAGLNWGHRPEHKRNPNQAYIPLTADICRSGFFPPPGVPFTVLTDDRKSLICTRAQAKGKAIQTPLNNSQLGEYFRHRLGLPSGAFVRKEDLEAYGRTSVTFHKEDEETYHMDFSPR